MLKLGIVQMSVQEGNTEENRRHLEHLVQTHSSDDIDLLCFPELCVSGYDFEKAAASDREDAFLADLARRYGIAILAGISRKEGDSFFDVSCIWDGQGRLLGRYRKIHLWDKENDFFEKGDELVTVSFKGWTIGLLICADLGFAELSKALALNREADVIIYPSAWYPGWDYLFANLSSIRAAENQVYTIGLNRAAGDVDYCGNSVVSNPDGSVLARLCTPGEAYARVVLKKERLQQARDAIVWRKMRREDVYRKIQEGDLYGKRNKNGKGCGCG
ncbi:MAG: carbon-nitrogen hydrolase family protein [Clostridium sp.]|jgi:predicted amidohydrolase|nr:carbon-nitrogen hydrolase family protein [Clostridium sp.]